MRTGFAAFSDQAAADLSVHTGCRHSAAAPAFNAQCEPEGCVTLPRLDLGEPAHRFARKPERFRERGKGQAFTPAVIQQRHALCSPEVNTASRRDFHLSLTDARSAFSQDVNMAAPDRPLWYLQEWFATQGRIQRDLITKLDWLPAKANKVWHGVQIAKLDEVADIADLLQIAPWELLMPPEEAMKLRRLRSVLAEVAQPAEPQPTALQSRPVVRTGTAG